MLEVTKTQTNCNSIVYLFDCFWNNSLNVLKNSTGLYINNMWIRRSACAVFNMFVLLFIQSIVVIHSEICFSFKIHPIGTNSLYINS